MTLRTLLSSWVWRFLTSDLDSSGSQDECTFDYHRPSGNNDNNIIELCRAQFENNDVFVSVSGGMAAYLTDLFCHMSLINGLRQANYSSSSWFPDLKLRWDLKTL